ncbi:GNAT family N-acetyltransferase [Candidatus Bipolaricaulota bacterium]|nr:GNAT family N-acetyltransferase [Candidatus Bipolaricaulota bacterium]
MKEHLDRTESWTVRPGRIEDARAVTRLFNARSQAFFGQNQAEEHKIRAGWEQPDVKLERDTRAYFDRSGDLIGWASVIDPGKPYIKPFAGVVTSPECSGDAALWDAMLTWAEQQSRTYIRLAPSHARVSLGAHAMVRDTHRWDAYERNGFARVRVMQRMKICFDSSYVPQMPQWPGEISLHPFALARDLEKVVAADQEAFRDHWGHVERPLQEELRQWKEWIQCEGNDFDPSLWFVAVDDACGEIAGYAICDPHIAGDRMRGYVNGLAVRAPWRKQGLGRALLHHAFAELRRRGCTAVELDMDSENLTGASRLYERAGMYPFSQEYAYEKELRPGIDLVRRALEP